MCLARVLIQGVVIQLFSPCHELPTPVNAIFIFIGPRSMLRGRNNDHLKELNSESEGSDSSDEHPSELSSETDATDGCGTDTDSHASYPCPTPPPSLSSLSGDDDISTLSTDQGAEINLTDPKKALDNLTAVKKLILFDPSKALQ